MDIYRPLYNQCIIMETLFQETGNPYAKEALKEAIEDTKERLANWTRPAQEERTMQ